MTGIGSGYSGSIVTGTEVCTTVSAGFSSLSGKFCSSDKYWGFAIIATKITIAMPAKRARTSPESTYNTGHGAIKNLHETKVPWIQPMHISGLLNPIKSYVPDFR
jgi:hypothetical protein